MPVPVFHIPDSDDSWLFELSLPLSTSRVSDSVTLLLIVKKKPSHALGCQRRCILVEKNQLGHGFSRYMDMGINVLHWGSARYCRTRKQIWWYCYLRISPWLSVWYRHVTRVALCCRCRSIPSRHFHDDTYTEDGCHLIADILPEIVGRDEKGRYCDFCIENIARATIQGQWQPRQRLAFVRPIQTHHFIHCPSISLRFFYSEPCTSTSLRKESATVRFHNLTHVMCKKYCRRSSKMIRNSFERMPTAYSYCY